MTYTEMAAQSLVGPNVRAAGGEPWDAIVALIRDLVRDLLNGCAPTPAEGYEYLTREHSWWERLLGADRRRERAVRLAVRRRYRGGDETAAALAADVLACCRDGRLNPALMRGLYDEARR